MKVASYFSLHGATQSTFELWLNTLPHRLRAGQRELLWLRSKGKKAVLWKEGCFQFF